MYEGARNQREDRGHVLSAAMIPPRLCSIHSPMASFSPVNHDSGAQPAACPSLCVLFVLNSPCLVLFKRGTGRRENQAVAGLDSAGMPSQLNSEIRVPSLTRFSILSCTTQVIGALIMIKLDALWSGEVVMAHAHRSLACLLKKPVGDPGESSGHTVIPTHEDIN